MPRYSAKKVYQLGDYWLSKRAGSDAWNRTWFDSEARQTRRIGLATDNLDEAKQALNDWFILHHTKTEQKAQPQHGSPSAHNRQGGAQLVMEARRY